MKNFYKPHEAAALAGVTVRTLHHYDRIGLLRPSGRTPSGYRIYSQGDLLRLQHIAVFKFLGLTLDDIRNIIDRAPTDIAEALRLHRSLLRERRSQIDHALRVIDLAEQRGFGPEALAQSMEAVRMSSRKEWMGRYYSPEALTKIRDNAARMSAEQLANSQRRWQELIAEVETAATSENPASPRARELAQRWQALIREFTQGDPEISAGLQKLYSDRQNWPADFKSPYSDQAERFIREATKNLTL